MMFVTLAHLDAKLILQYSSYVAHRNLFTQLSCTLLMFHYNVIMHLLIFIQVIKISR